MTLALAKLAALEPGHVPGVPGRYNRPCCELTCGWMVRGIMVSSAYQGSNPDARIYFWIYFRISSDAHSVGGDVPVDDEVSTVTS